MSDQYTGSIRDSDVKFQCRLLIFAISNMDLSTEQKDILLESIAEIVSLENKRLDDLS